MKHFTQRFSYMNKKPCSFHLNKLDNYIGGGGDHYI